MTYTPAFGQAKADDDTFAVARPQVARVELVIDSHRITGDLRYGGPPRRLVDILNALDGGYATVFAGSMASSQRPDEDVQEFDIAQVRRDAILFAVPLGDTPAPGSSGEAVR